MIASRASWRFAWLAAAVLVGLVLAFARGATPQATPDLSLPHLRERIDDGPRDTTLRIDVDRGPGLLNDALIERPSNRGF